jgi:hypothetical protein
MLSVYTRHHPDCKNAGAALALTKSSMGIETVATNIPCFDIGCPGIPGISI